MYVLQYITHKSTGCCCGKVDYILQTVHTS